MSKRVRSSLLGALLCAGSVASFNAAATDFTVEVTNLTGGIYFTPLLITAHPEGNALFTAGDTASASLQAMAEGGDISGLSADVASVGAVSVGNPAGGLLGPGESIGADLNTDASPDNTQLSVVAMMLPTNDGFVGLNSITIPTEPGIYTYDVDAYDAGTEGNDETVGTGAIGAPGFPAPGPVAATTGTGGTGVATDAENFVHIHRNVLGDTDANGGASDIDSTVHRWLNPVARVVITVN